MQTVDAKVLSRIYGSGRGMICSPNDFYDLGGRAAIDKVLSRMAAKGTVRRLARGLYEYPKIHPEFGILSPDIDKVAKALARKYQIRLQPAGAYAANLLGLSEQVPAKVAFLTDGPTRTLKIGRQEIRLRHTTPGNMATAGRLSGLLMQALRNIGKQNVTTVRLQHLRRTVPLKERLKLLKDLSLVPAWMHEFFRELAKGDS